jgi:hypothetical protein
MTATTIKAPRKRYPSDDRDGDRRLRPLRMFGDIGPGNCEADYKPITVRNPEEDLAAIFALLGHDYGGPMPAARC